MTRIVIARHGNTFDKGDIITRVGARTDMPLSTSGLIQIEGLKHSLSPKNSGFNFVKAYCSNLKRTQETGKIILSSGHAVQECQVLPFLTEIDYGIDENKAEEDVIARLGQEAIDLWDTQATPPDGWHVFPDEIIKSWREFFHEMQSIQGDILIISSNGITRFALDAVDEIPADVPKKLRTAAFGIADLTHDKVCITSWDQRSLPVISRT